jgi:DNA helicase-2/ATP-dependent DNA helicase PcrA
MKEADLCGSVSMQERIFISTVHKAKGLEFDNVIVYDAVEGKFPSYYANSNESQEEEARKFYVAISRAKKRLFIAISQQQVSRWGRLYARQPSPLLNTIRQFFA